MNPKVSIIIPCYNTESYIDCCVNSLVQQTLKDIEIIIVDDGSPDHIPEICDKWSQRDSRIKVIHKENAGQGFARNSGLSIATGDYIIFVDSDDYIELNALDYAYNLCEKHGLDILRYESNRFTEEDAFDKVVALNEDLTIIDDSTTIIKMGKWLFGHNPTSQERRVFFYGSACMEMIRHSLIKNNCIAFVSERECISEDYLFTYQCLKHCRKFGHTPATLYHYRNTPQSFSRITRLDGVERQYKLSRIIEELLIKDGYGLDSSIIAMHHFINELRSTTKIIIRSSLTRSEKRKWFMENMKHEYIEKVYKSFPWKHLPIKERIHFLACYYRIYPLVLLLTQFQKK